ncbi:hypothetical protein FHS83_001572 [Rhizomicrobium palustre]|uniref:Uncharacterized protein n=1 Tax=Rhizomicrobium palustre TaxID=189966 RepID=A0A846MXF9_9PROT|nr:hypothetical protein [Rhizomicrobium palustre]NIK88254.1 hypothetical protein [Rhizomicrobium palustre]
MNTSGPAESALFDAPEAILLHAKFLAMRQELQGLMVKKADWNVKKAKLKKRRRWSTKRQLVPPAQRHKLLRPSGAQEGNENRLSHGKRTRDRELFRAMIRSHVRAGKILVTAVRVERKKKKEAARAA